MTNDPIATSPAASPEQPARGSSDHATHGRVTAEDHPNLSHCPCCGGPQQSDCAAAGCGYCSVDGLEPYRTKASAEQRAACLHPPDDRAPVSGDSWLCGLCGADSAPPEQAPAELTAEGLDELDRRAREAAEMARKATAGPWRAERGCVLPPEDAERGPVKALLEPQILIAAGTAGECDANSVFAAAAREDVPALSAAVLALSAEVRRLREENARMRPVVEAAETWNESSAMAGEMALSEALRVYADEPPRAEEERKDG